MCPGRKTGTQENVQNTDSLEFEIYRKSCTGRVCKDPSILLSKRPLRYTCF